MSRQNRFKNFFYFKNKLDDLFSLRARHLVPCDLFYAELMCCSLEVLRIFCKGLWIARALTDQRHAAHTSNVNTRIDIDWMQCSRIWCKLGISLLKKNMVIPDNNVVSDPNHVLNSVYWE